MITKRNATDRGAINIGWLDSKHTFSFGSYHDPDHMGFGNLRVINEDRVEPGQGFATHGHRDMEIISYIIEGALEHKDSMGNGSVMQSGEVQRMTAGTGVTHSEFNHSNDEQVHFLQIWIVPDQQALQPGYEQKLFSREDKQDRLQPIASQDGAEGALKVHQDVRVYASLMSTGTELVHALAQGRRAWLQVIRGHISIDGENLRAGDGAAIADTGQLKLTAAEESELLLFDLG